MLGRLTPLKTGTVGQEVPTDWERELSLLNTIGANCIEWLVTSANSNPLYDNDLSPFPVASINIHHLTESSLSTHELEYICESALDQKIFNLTLPLMEVTSLKNQIQRKKIISRVLKVVKKYPKINFCLETELSAVDMIPILNLAPNLNVTYDTGNITFYGYDHEKEILTYKENIKIVHLKDKDSKGQSVQPFTGETDFQKIFKSLKKIGYNGPYILETARSSRGHEVNFMTDHIRKFKCLV